MSFGARLYRITRRRWAVAGSLMLAVLASVFTVYRPSLVPPGLHARGLSIGTASTELLVARPDLPVGSLSTDNYGALVDRSILVGNVMVTPPVLDYAGRAIGVDPARIQGTAPMIADVPRALTEPGSGAGATDILNSPDQYRLEIQADPTVPILHIYTQAPSGSQAIHLAQAAVTGLETYLQKIAAEGKVPPANQVQVEELGGVRGGVANPGASTEMAVLVFVGVFGTSLWVSTLVAKVRGGWTAARLSEGPAT